MSTGKRGCESYNNTHGALDCDKSDNVNLEFHYHPRKTTMMMMPEEQRMNMNTCCPFTANQREELERQTIIYKYMMASMPVPPQLLLPLSKGGGGGGGGGGGRGAGDLEPWRCRRTDGKKWRCSRDVAPDQKYCERHSHKSRPSARSRKPVESSSTSSSSSVLCNSNTSGSNSSSVGGSGSVNLAMGSNSLDFSSPLLPYNLLPNPTSYRYPERFMKKDGLPAANLGAHQRHPQLGHHIPIHEDQQNNNIRPFIDAWSLADHPTTTTATTAATSSPAANILPLSLSVSSGGGVGLDDVSGGDLHGHPEEHHHGHAGGGGMMMMRATSQPLNWMTSWISSPPGGPLAEALCLGMAGPAAEEEYVSSSPPPMLYGRSSSSTPTSAGSKDTVNEQIFRLH